MPVALAVQRHPHAVVVLCTAVAFVAMAGPAAGFKHKVPDAFQPLDEVLPMASGPLEQRDPLEFDLAAGGALAQCPPGLWTGSVTYRGHAGGDVEYTGTFLRCFPFGTGKVRYPDGTSYEGQVNSYVQGDLTRFDATNTRMATREGRGRFTKADGKVLDRSFVGGTAADDANDARIVAFRSALARLEPLAGVTLGPVAGASAAAAPAPKKQKTSGGFLGELEKLAGGTLAGVDKLDQKGVATMAKAKVGADQVDGKVTAAMSEASAMPSPFPAASPPVTPLPGRFESPQSRGAGSCLTGTWQRRICGGAKLAEVGFSGGAAGTGYFKDADCAAVCGQGRRFDFQYRVEGDGVLRIDYTRGQVCGEPALPQGGQQPFSCAATSLQFGNQFQKASGNYAGGG